MGAIFSRWRKQETTEQILEALDKDIKNLEKQKQSNLTRQKKIIGSLILYSVLLYMVSVLVFYFRYLPDTWPDRLLYATPLMGFGLLIWLVKRFLHWYFVNRISKNEAALEELQEKKKTILEEVMENETYKKAKEILQKYDPEQFKKIQAPETTPAPVQSPNGQELRQRSVGRGLNTPVSRQMAQRGPPSGRGRQVAMVTPHPMSAGPSGNPTVTSPQDGARSRMATPAMVAAPLPMPRSILPRERTTMDRLVEYLVGDGPQNRYALICVQCQSHNGMALREEFEYISFRCCYCFAINEARKQKPRAPRIDGATGGMTARRQLPLSEQPLMEHAMEVDDQEETSEKDEVNDGTDEDGSDSGATSAVSAKNSRSSVESLCAGTSHHPEVKAKLEPTVKVKEEANISDDLDD